VTSRREVVALAAPAGIPIAAAHPHAAIDGKAHPLATPGAGDVVCPPYKL
jgi:hypothetical protein